MRVFISYSAKDGSAAAKKLHETLHKYGHDAFFIDQDAAAGEQIWGKIGQELLSRERTIFILTPSSLGSKGQKQEYELVCQKYGKHLTFIRKDLGTTKAFQEYPFLGTCKASFFEDSTLDAACNDLAVEIGKLQDTGEKRESPFTEIIIPKLSRKGLDNGEINKSIDNLNKGFQKSTIIPEIARTQVISKDDVKTTNMGFVIRLPIEWFKPKREDVCNDPFFIDLGRDIAFAERNQIDSAITVNTEVATVDGGLSKDNVVKAVEQLKASGFEADLIFPTIKDYMDMHHLKDTNVEYTHDNTQFINSFFTSDKYRIGIVTPLGDMPSKTTIFSKQAITWHARPNKDYGALHISMGLDRLYPLKFVEVIGIEMAKCEIKGKGIVRI
jgi:hypothetical protein